MGVAQAAKVLERSTDSASCLALHRKRRQGGVPTLTVLVADPSHLSVTSRTIACHDVDRMAQAWFEAVGPRADLRVAAAKNLGKSLGRASPHWAEEVTRKPAEDLRAVLEDARGVTEDSHLEVIRWLLLDGTWSGRPGHLATPEVMAVILHLVPDSLSIDFLIDGSQASVEWLASCAESLARWVSAAPRLELILNVSPDQLSFVLAGQPSRAQTLIREGLILERKAEARAPTAETRPERPRDARSAAEQFLYERLQHFPPTAGLFVLNQVVEDPVAAEDFGRCEVDLLCRSLRIAIEVDGHFHFQEDDAFRRDRRKDLALQKAGFLVLRFLAQDVVAELEQILRTVEGAVLFCRKQRSSR